MSDFIDIHALADGQLCDEERAKVAARLENCKVSKAEYDAVVSLKTVLKEKSPEHTCIRTWKNCTTRLDELEKKRKAESFVSRYAWAMCGTIFAIIVGAGLLNRNAGQEVAAGDVARMVAGISPFTRNASVDGQDMGNWIKDVSRGAPITVETGSLKVMRWAQGIDNGRPFTVLYCVDEKGPINLLIIKGADRMSGFEPMVGNGPYWSGQIEMMNCLSWVDKDYAFILVADRPCEEMCKVAESIRLR
jgi:hypothetical protein